MGYGLVVVRDVEKGHAWNGLMVQKTILVQIQLVALALVLRSAAGYCRTVVEK